jgi:uncharacterized protein with PQ loop repeat
MLDLPTIGSACITLALVLDSTSYYRQIAKTLKTKKSKDVSSSAYLYKIMKAILAGVGLVIFSNYVGLAMEMVMLVVYVVSLYVICRFKPKNWSLFGK